MEEVEAAGRAQLRRVARDLQAMRFRLQGVAWNLLSDSHSEEERGGGERPPSFAAQARAVIDCVVADCLIPARHDLQAAARFVPEEETHPSLGLRPGIAGPLSGRSEIPERPEEPEEHE